MCLEFRCQPGLGSETRVIPVSGHSAGKGTQQQGHSEQLNVVEGKAELEGCAWSLGITCTDQSCSVSAASDQHPAPLRLRYLRPLLALRVQHVLALHVLTP